MHLLDANILIEHLAGRFDITEHVKRAGLAECGIPTITVYELLHGALRSSRSSEYSRTREMLAGFHCKPFDEASAETAARLRFELERSGLVIGPHDLMIAAIAVAHNYTLVTHNVREFLRVDGLKVEDWKAKG